MDAGPGTVTLISGPGTEYSGTVTSGIPIKVTVPEYCSVSWTDTPEARRYVGTGG